MNEEVIATAKEQFFTMGATYDITDASGNLIGVFHHELRKSMFSLGSVFSIRDPFGVPYLLTKEISFAGSDIIIYNQQNQVVCQLVRLSVFIKKVWDVIIMGNIDRRIAAMLPSFIESIRQNQQ